MYSNPGKRRLMSLGILLGFLFAASSLMAGGDVVAGQEQKPSAEKTEVSSEQICHTLFIRYLQGKKVNSSTIDSSVQLIADICRRTPFWHVLLDDVRRGDQFSLRYSVRILGKMLEVDAVARELIAARERGEQVRSPWMPDICLGEEVVEVLLGRADQEEVRFLLETYVIALARARDERARDFFDSILDGASRRNEHLSVQFHAAVGLVGLGDETGVEWLINHIGKRQFKITGAWPGNVPDKDISICCRYALRQLAAGATYETRQQWLDWWEKSKASLRPSNRIYLVDRQW